MIQNIYYKTPNVYIALAEKYDPTGEYTKRFEEWFDEQKAFNDLNETIETKNSSDVFPLIPDNNQGVLMISKTIMKFINLKLYFNVSGSSISNTQNRRDSEKTSGPTKISLILASMATTTEIPTTTPQTVRISLRTTTPSTRTSTQKTEQISSDQEVKKNH